MEENMQLCEELVDDGFFACPRHFCPKMSICPLFWNPDLRHWIHHSALSYDFEGFETMMQKQVR